MDDNGYQRMPPREPYGSGGLVKHNSIISSYFQSSLMLINQHRLSQFVSYICMNKC